MGGTFDAEFFYTLIYTKRLYAHPPPPPKAEHTSPPHTSPLLPSLASTRLSSSSSGWVTPGWSPPLPLLPPTTRGST